MPADSRFHILVHVISCLFQKFSLSRRACGSIPEIVTLRHLPRALLLSVGLLAAFPATSSQESVLQQREDFSRAWQAAGRGDRAVFEQLMPGLQDYLLYPYLQYEDLRHRRSRADVKQMAEFLAAHEGWAFTAGLEKAWLRTLGKRKNWQAVITHAASSTDTEVRCYLAQARIELGQTDGLISVAQNLWAVGKSQPDACDPVFKWLERKGGITPGLAWQRVRLAMEARQPRMTVYLARFVASDDRVWVERWQQQDRSGYRRLDQAVSWGDNPRSRDIVRYGIGRLARNDPDRAWQVQQALEGHFAWPEEAANAMLGEIALWSAVDGSAATPDRMQAVPPAWRDDKLLEWWVRHDLGRGAWDEIVTTIEAMSPELKDDSRWRYWDARSRLESGDTTVARERMSSLALEANYYGFLAADLMGTPYTICPEEPTVSDEAVGHLGTQPGFDRALELRKIGIRNWSRSEWRLATSRRDTQDLRTAAALAVREDWPEMAIFALGNSGDLRWYEWRFPLQFGSLVKTNAQKNRLDSYWIMGLMRSESAMAVDAVSPAGALGLMQIMPQTAKELAQRHGFSYTGRSQMLQAEDNIQFGTAFLRDLLDRYDGNQVLASGAYNAGPHVVDKWLSGRRSPDPAIWVETLPYYETRDYIPRVLAFSTIYNWRLQLPVSRLSSRMPSFDSPAANGTMKPRDTAEVVCRNPG